MKSLLEKLLRMPRPGLPVTTAALAAFVVTGGLPAQTVASRPEPGSIPLPIQSEDSDPAEPDRDPALAAGHGMVRVWNFAGPAAEVGLGVFLGRPGDAPPPESERIWLARGFRNGERKNYREIRAGRYELYVIADPSRQGALMPVPETIAPNEMRLAQRTGITVGNGTYHTLLLRATDGLLVVESLRDDLLDPAAKTLRIWNLLPETTPTISRIEQEGQRVAVVRSMSPGAQTVPIPPDTRLLTLEIAHPLPTGATARWNAELDFSSVRSCSLLLHHDRYGRTTSTATADAPVALTSPIPLP